jgi:hypothetical protein
MISIWLKNKAFSNLRVVENIEKSDRKVGLI